jgi:hypothetical protein
MIVREADMRTYPNSTEAHGTIGAPVTDVFAFLDDQANLSAHMSKPSAMMLGSTMDIHMEPDHTRSVGSRFGFTGCVLGIPMVVDEVVTSREPPFSKSWETTREPQLWVIGSYQMGFALTAQGKRTTIKVHLGYDLPTSGLPYVLGRLFARYYAKWCTSQMVSDAGKHFSAHTGTA